MRVSETLSWPDTHYISNVTIECDSLLTVSAINNLKTNLLEVGDVIDSCNERLQGKPDISLVHVRKQTNKTVHLLAGCPRNIG